MKKKILPLFTVAYLSALAAIAVLSVTVHVVEGRAIRAQEQHAEIINVAGKQRMLSQRISYLELRLADLPPGSARDQASAQLLAAIEGMERNHYRLRYGDLLVDQRSPKADELEWVYEEAGLAAAVDTFLTHARFVLTEDEVHRQEAALKVESSALLHQLDGAVSLYQENAQAEIAAVEHLTMWAAVGILTLLALEALFIFAPVGRRLAKAEHELKEIAATDALTGCRNRRGLLNAATVAIGFHARRELSIGVITFDIDHFKAVNDTYGHSVGDEVIRFIVRVTQQRLRAADILGRIGGEEFVLFCPDTDLQQAYTVAEKVRVAIERTAFASEGVELKLSASFGVTSVVPDALMAPETLIEWADAALYEAKRSGRNRTIAAQGIPERSDDDEPQTGLALVS